MSLDVYLIGKNPMDVPVGTGIFVRDKGKTKELSFSEAKAIYPDANIEEPTGYEETTELYQDNITHNLGEMATECGLYNALWRPYRLHPNYDVSLEQDHNKEWEFEDSVTTLAKDIVGELTNGLAELLFYPEKYKKLNPENGWGSYEGLCDFTYNYIQACNRYPDAIIKVSR